MKKLTIILILLLTSSGTIFAQTKTDFSKGYFITNAGDRVDCDIDIIRWPIVPNVITYRQDRTRKEVNRADIAEIVIEGRYKHVRMTVDMDRSTTQLDQLDSDKELHMEEANLLLEVLVEGAAVLYYYPERHFNRLFYRVGDQPVQQLIYKLYRKESGDLGANMGYKQQLWEDLKCDDIKLTEIGELMYDFREMIRFFRKYNDCQPGGQTGFGSNSRIRPLYLSVFGGPYFGAFRYESASTIGITSLGQSNGVSFGFDLEYIPGARNSKWSVYIAPYLHSNKASFTDQNLSVDINFRMTKMPIGARYNLLRGGNSKLHVDAAFVFSFDGGSTIKLDAEEEELTDSATAWSLGLGGNITNRLYGRAQYILPTAVNGKDTDASATVSYGHFFLSLGYRVIR